jgi:hypothetical protein
MKAPASPGGTESADPFDRFDHRDGFHVLRVGNDALLGLYAVAYGGGRAFTLDDPAAPEDGSVELVSWESPTPADRGACKRLHFALDAVCRYLNTGGSWADLGAALARLQRVAVDGIAWPGYYLYDSHPTVDGPFEHVFVMTDGTDTARVWLEPKYGEAGSPLDTGYVDDPTPLADVLASVAAEEELTDDVRGPLRPAPPPAPPDPLQLPAGPGPGTAGDLAGGPDDGIFGDAAAGL